jgi:hypothetical protein
MTKIHQDYGFGLKFRAKEQVFREKILKIKNFLFLFIQGFSKEFILQITQKNKKCLT